MEQFLRNLLVVEDFPLACAPGVVVVFIHEMSTVECNEILERTNVGRLACAHDNQPYVVPINFAFDGCYFYGFTTLGQKVEWMRSNPLVCLEVDETTNESQWTSIVALGRYEELLDEPEYEQARTRAHSFLQKRATWWEPAYISKEHQDQPHSLTPIFYRIRVNQITGHRANTDEREAETAAADHSSDQPSQVHRLVSQPTRSITIVKAAVLYFVLVFGAGFLLGPIRILFVVPRLGERVAELLEAPLMLAVIVLAAKWIVRRFQLPPGVIYRLGVGLIAFVLGILFEFTAVLKLRGLTLTEYFQTRDPVSGTIYYIALILFAVMPLLVRRNQ
jgi:nitroimidazol reductase NimA-like FMN-containing flavoprotein (pyridoxamine 5'-phosphate oxidase superfamily)